MSNVELIIEERAADIGNFMVGRLLPFVQKRSIGPFVFIDHMGPKHLGPNENLDVGPHPHIGLSTLTFLFEGSIMHKDSIGSAVEIEPGAVNWMTAGKGIVHSERTPERLRNKSKTVHGMQIWVALPKELEIMEPSFTHVEADDIPTWEQDGMSFKLIAGEAFGKKSPVPVHTPLYMIEVKSTEGGVVNIGDDLFGESGLYILEGAIKSDINRYEPRQILIAKDTKLCQFEMEPNTTVYIFGGDALPEKRYLYWNFVATSRERIEEAKQDWIDQKIGIIEGETDIVPLPPQHKGIRIKE